MGRIRIGCQTYSWQMSGQTYLDDLPHIIEVAARAGFAGLEPETQFLGRLWQPERMAETLQTHNISLAALTLVEDWLHFQETEQERANADRTMDFLAHFPGTMLVLVQMPGSDRAHLKERRAHLLSCVNAVARRAHERRIAATYHPNSPAGSLVRTAQDYEQFLSRLDAEVIGYAPDVGHIAKGDMDPLEVIQRYRPLVNHVHYKDIAGDGTWAATGEGSIDFEGITRYLRDSGYSGWIVMEDECSRAVDGPDELTLQDGEYLRQRLLPMLSAE
jgi:inosose dehydratase